MAPLRIVRRYFFGDIPELTPEERRLVLRVVAVTSIPLALVTASILILGGSVAVVKLRERTEQNKQAIERAEDAIAQANRAAEAAAVLALRLDEQRDETAKILAWQVYDQCIENENQDESNIALFRKVRAQAQQVQEEDPSPTRAELIEQLTKTIDAREPDDEMDCLRPSSPRPEGKIP